MSQVDCENMNLCHVMYGKLAEVLPNCRSWAHGTSFAIQGVACLSWSSDDTP